MATREQAMHLCKEGDQQLAEEELSLATAFYMAAFSCSAPVAVEKVASLEKESQAKVIAILETWCRGGSPIPRVPCSSLNTPSLNVGIAAVFLSTLSPNNIAAFLCKMEALLKLGRYEEVAGRCCSLLDSHDCIELVLTKALALVLSKTHFQNGVTDYLHAFEKDQDETVKFVSSRQKGHLQKIIQAFLNFLSGQENGHRNQSLESRLSSCYDFLVTIAPEDIHVCQVQAAYFFEKHKYKECVSIYSKALEALSASGALWDEKASSLLMDRAVSYFSLGGRVQEMIQDLTEAFKVNASLSKRRFDELFSAGDTERIEEHARASLDVEFAAYREAVRMRPEVRSDGGKELLSPVIGTLRLLIEISPGARRELRVRLADCYVLEGNIKNALELCNCLLESENETYCNTLFALRGFCYLHTQRFDESLQDFQKIIEHNSPHPSSCVKALCGRGLIRILSGNPYLAALDYITACRLRFEETSFVVKSYVPWNQRGYLVKVLQEEGQKILEKNENPRRNSASQRDKSKVLNGFLTKEGDASGAHQLASLLLELDASEEASQILCADALYQMDRVEESHKILLVALSKATQRSAILARLAVLQLKRSFVYDCNQLLKKMIQSGDTCCLLAIVKILKDEDRALLQSHCHTRAMTILKNKQGDGYIKEAITYLSFAITAAGGFAVDSLLTRARCYGHLGQKKTAIFDFNAILKEDPRNVQALSGRGFIHLALNQKKEAVCDLISAIQADSALAISEILSLKQEAQTLILHWLLDHCRTVLFGLGAGKEPSDRENLKELTIVGESLVKINSKETKSHILYVDMLTAGGRHKEALAHLQGSFGQTAPDDSVNSRFGMLQVKKRNIYTAAHILAGLAAKDYDELPFLLNFLDTKQRQSLAQVAAKEGNVLVKDDCHRKAVGYYSLAVSASDNNPRYLRQRASCLAYLKDYRRALKDMDKVVQNHRTNSLKTKVEDFCSQGHMLLAISEDNEAVKQFIKALQMEQTLALTNIAAGPNRDVLSKAFLQTAQSCFDTSLFEEAWTATEYGLVIDPNSNDLKKLKTRLKREAFGCRVH
ncbi:tetratricopeptide repeat protein 34 [Eublepharis macularius]|uniref:Tetratricopeptide repeat protein 34 n=1 Tax=Eublepharis macularius TaxID=481883 RepID=A0AA97KIM2_EUBMA|nr:tetratricopeptide repeat protein 34 [Eublepharis macularius]